MRAVLSNLNKQTKYSSENGQVHGVDWTWVVKAANVQQNSSRNFGQDEKMIRNSGSLEEKQINEQWLNV